MKKITKILALTLAVVLLSTLLVGCSLFGIDNARYRAQVAITVGDEKVTVGDVADLYTSNFYNYYSYVQGGQMTIEQVFDMTMNSIYTTYSKMDSYKTSDYATKYTDGKDGLATDIANSEYLTVEELQFALSYAKYSLHTVLDNSVESYISAEVAKLAEEQTEEDRDFAETDKMTDAEGNAYASYADKLYADTIVNEDMEEYFDTYYSHEGFDKYALSIDSYTYTEAQAQAKVDSINDRLEDYVVAEEGEQENDYVFPNSVFPTIDASEYIEWQKKAVKNYLKTVDTNYDLDAVGYVKMQAESIAKSIINAKWDLHVAQGVESDADLNESLTDRFNSNLNAFKTETNINPDSYLTFIGSLADNSYIYNVPELYEDDFIFVKNLLVPFSPEQSAKLATLAKLYGITNTNNLGNDANSIAYREARNKLVKDIVATDFDNDENEVEGLFDYVGGEVVLQGDLLAKLPNDGTVTPEQFQEAMVQYNTDTAQHSKYYEYVVYVGEENSNYTHPWVSEFVEAAEDAKSAGQYKYGICVSEFGVHIVYYSSDVVAWDSYDTDKRLDASSQEYRFFKTYYQDTLSQLKTQASEDLEDAYRYGGKIEMKKGLSNMLQELGLEFDFDKSITKEEQE